jgi:hypothetical protein
VSRPASSTRASALRLHGAEHRRAGCLPAADRPPRLAGHALRGRRLRPEPHRRDLLLVPHPRRPRRRLHRRAGRAADIRRGGERAVLTTGSALPDAYITEDRVSKMVAIRIEERLLAGVDREPRRAGPVAGAGDPRGPRPLDRTPPARGAIRRGQDAFAFGAPDRRRQVLVLTREMIGRLQTSSWHRSLVRERSDGGWWKGRGVSFPAPPLRHLDLELRDGWHGRIARVSLVERSSSAARNTPTAVLGASPVRFGIS